MGTPGLRGLRLLLRLAFAFRLRTEPVPAKRGIGEPLQVHQCAFETALAQVRPRARKVCDQIELQMEPLGSRSDQLCIHGGFFGGLRGGFKLHRSLGPHSINGWPSLIVPTRRAGRQFPPPTPPCQRAGELRCTCSVIRMAVSRARMPASPPTMGGLPVRMQSRNDSISAFKASPCSKLCSSMEAGSCPGGASNRLRITVRIFCCRSRERYAASTNTRSLR